MSKKNKKEENWILELKKASEAYYLNQPIMTDEEFDLIQDEYKRLYPNHPFWKEVGTKIKSSPFKKVKHSIPMGSLLKINTQQELNSWISKYVNKNKILWSEKVDGLSISLYFENGNLTKAITRGDGEIGEDVSSNVFKMKILKQLKSKFTGFIRGEIFLKKSDFNKNFKDFANPRNAAAGLVRRLDGESSEHLSIYCYWIEGEFETEQERFKKIEKLGLETPQWGVVDSEEKIQKIWQKYEDSSREKLDYEIDGICLYNNSVKEQDELGIVDNRPRFARAYKFSPQVGVSKLNTVQWQVGRTGRITPVAQIDPVNVAGATISNVTLHNLAEIKRLNVKIGSVIHISRAGDVIPKIIKATSGKEEISVPKKCPVCSSQLKREEIFLICENKNCSEQIIESLLFWLKTLDIKGFGDKMVKKLFEEKKVLKIADFYKLKIEDLSSIERSGEKLATKLVDSLNSKKEIEPELFLKGLGIEDFGESVAKLILEKYSFDSIFSLKFEDLTKIHGIGEETAKKVIEGLKEKKEEIKDLLKIISLKEKKEGPLTGKSYCFTEFRDKDLEEKIKQAGGSISDSVNKSLTALIVKNKNGSSSKIEKAKKYGLIIMDLEEALKKDFKNI